MNEHANAASSRLTAPEIASELNNLLQIISGSSELIENIWEGKPGAAKYFSMLRESVARAADVTTDLVELSGRLSGKIVLHPDFARRLTAPNTARKRVMIVDDEKMLLILTSEILREAGYDVVTAQSGFECLDQFRLSGRQFDLVLLDLNMPLMDGEETFQRLRALQPDLPIMLCTGYVQQERLDQLLAAGLSGFVQKPLGPRQCLASVRALLEDGEPEIVAAS